MRVGPQRSRRLAQDFRPALHFARLPDRVIGGMSIFRKYRLGVALEILMSKVVEQNTLKRRGVGLRVCDPERACPGFTLFAPVFEQNRTVYLIDLQAS